MKDYVIREGNSEEADQIVDRIVECPQGHKRYFMKKII